ncbi:cache domain-containing protein [Ramlibacter aquaticus]|uniref:Cache domain-containing protein n=1 Tax=Ramlibacter aquaticus TaxID=2780094 RepID=A0ABR9SC55_9BURK|nr:cache domain-containing protein [Ramlibacter aquaticus]MBE7939886.1 cache domain-containing protein [Ramlibacter aquaticus]
MADSQPERQGRPRAVLAPLILLALLPIALLLGGQLVGRLRAERAQVEAALAASADTVAARVARELQSSVDALDVLSRSELFQQGRVTALGRLLHGRPRPDWDSLFLLDAGGTPVLDTAATPPSPAMRSVMDGLRAQVVATGRPALSGVGAAGATPAPAVAVALPVRSGERIAYVLGARMGAATFQRLASGSTTGLDDRVCITDAQSRVIADSSGLPQGLVLSHEDPALAFAWHTVPGFGWQVRVAQPMAPLAQARRDAILWALLTQGGALLAGAVLAYAWGRRRGVTGT